MTSSRVNDPRSVAVIGSRISGPADSLDKRNSTNPQSWLVKIQKGQYTPTDFSFIRIKIRSTEKTAFHVECVLPNPWLSSMALTLFGGGAFLFVIVSFCFPLPVG